MHASRASSAAATGFPTTHHQPRAECVHAWAYLSVPPCCLPQLWTRVADQTMISMVCFHLMMVGILGIKKSIGAPIFTAILLIFDVIFM